VLRSTGLVRSRLGDSVVDNLRNMFRRFESDEVPGALVAARAAAGGEVRARADQEGYFEVVLDLPRPLDGARVWEPVELELLEPAGTAGPVRAAGQVLVPRDPQYAVISDLDDTVLHSNATSLWQMARLTLLHNAHTRLPFEGVAGFYQALQRGRDGEAYNPVFYVSNGPWNLYDLLEDFLDVHGIPRGPLLLRDWSLRTLRAGEPHKLAAIQALLDTYPGLQATRRSTARSCCATRAGSWPCTSATSPPPATPPCARSPPSWPATASTWSSRPTPRRPAATPSTTA
jgi:phosphatidate phosphatase APP1